MPGAGDVRGNRYQADAGQSDLIALPKTSTAAPHAQKALDGHPAGWGR